MIEAKRWAPYWNNSKNPSQPKPLIATAQAGSHNVTIRGPPPTRGGSTAVLRMHKYDYINSSLYPIHDEWRYGSEFNHRLAPTCFAPDQVIAYDIACQPGALTSRPLNVKT